MPISLQARLREFSSRENWKQSKHKPQNIWRNFEGLNLTIFRRSDGWYGWVFADNEGPHYSPGGFETIDDAIEALSGELFLEEYAR